MDDPPRPGIASPTLGYDSEDPRVPPSTGAQAPPFDAAAFKDYLTQLLPLVIGANPLELRSLFESGQFVERSTRWATDPNAGALYVVKSREEDEDAEETGERDSGSVAVDLRLMS